MDRLLNIGDLRESIDMPLLPGEEEGEYQTVGGFVIHQMKSIPSAGQRFDWGRWRFEVMDMDGRRVDKILVSERHPNG